MKSIMVICLSSLVLLGWIAYRNWADDAATQKREIEGRDAADLNRTDEELTDRHEGVGWVFGRMVGVSESPGSSNHSPFGKPTRSANPHR